jgi:hypothetical protein
VAGETVSPLQCWLHPRRAARQIRQGRGIFETFDRLAGLIVVQHETIERLAGHPVPVPEPRHLRPVK